MSYDLNKYSIHSLRIMAREKGVVAPTKFKKQELIEKIINCEYEKDSNFSKRGRKAKEFNINYELDEDLSILKAECVKLKDCAINVLKILEEIFDK